MPNKNWGGARPNTGPKVSEAGERNITIRCLVSKSEKAELERLCKENGLKLSEFIRKKIFE